MKLKSLLSLLALFTVMIGAWASPAGPSAALASPHRDADPGRGASLYQQFDCLRCHQADAGGGTGPNGEEAPKIAGVRMSYQDFLDQLRTPVGDMQAFPDISDSDATDIYAYLKSL